MGNVVRILMVHLASVALLVVCAVALNMLAWTTTPDPFPDTLWNLIVMPGIRIFAAIGSIGAVLYGATSPITLRLLRLHIHRISS